MISLYDSIPLRDIRPDPNNPRKDFGDLDALAATFEANAADPGEPFTPIRVVRDGERFRILDGERRYRAMVKAGRVISCHALVCDSMDDAAALLEMMASDDKMALTAAEKSRGFQMSLAVGADDELAEKAAKVPAGTAAKVRAARSEVHERADQMTLDQLAAIAEYAGDDDAVRRLSGAGWVHEKTMLDKRRENRGRYDALAGAVARCGLELTPRDEVPRTYRFRDKFLVPSSVANAVNSPHWPKGGFALVMDEPVALWSIVRLELWVESDEDESPEERREREISERASALMEQQEADIGARCGYLAALVASTGWPAAREGLRNVFPLVHSFAADADGRSYGCPAAAGMMASVARFNDAAGSELAFEWDAASFCATFLDALPELSEWEMRRFAGGAAAGGDFDDACTWLEWHAACRADGFPVEAASEIDGLLAGAVSGGE